MFYLVNMWVACWFVLADGLIETLVQSVAISMKYCLCGFNAHACSAKCTPFDTGNPGSVLLKMKWVY